MLAPAQYCRIEHDPTRYYHMPVLGRVYRRRVTRCIEKLPAGHSILDIGYGSGVSFLALAEKFNEIHGADIHDATREVTESFAGTGINLLLRQASIFDLPYEDNTLDAAVAISLHEHLSPSDQRRAFSEVHRVLKPGGCYVIGVPGVHAFMTLAFYAIGWRINKHHICTHSQILGAMGDVLDVDDATHWPVWMSRRFPAYVAARGWKR